MSRDFVPRNFPIISSFKPPDIHEISDIIDELKTSSAVHDIISAFLVKQVKPSILQPFAYILSLSLKTGVVPVDLKITPLFKAGDSFVLITIDPYKNILIYLDSNSVLQNLRI